MRTKYTTHLAEITNRAPQFLICFEYDQQLMKGPPFSINANEINKHYAHLYKVTSIETTDAGEGLRKEVAATETVWLLHH